MLLCWAQKNLQTLNSETASLAKRDPSTSNGSTVNKSGSYKQIEDMVQHMFKKEPSQQNHCKNKRKREQQLTVSTETTTVMEVYKANCEKRLIRSEQLTEAEDENDFENRIIDNEGVDIEKMQQIQLSHRGSHQEMAYLDREVNRYVDGLQ